MVDGASTGQAVVGQLLSLQQHASQKYTPARTMTHEMPVLPWGHMLWSGKMLKRSHTWPSSQKASPLGDR